MFFDPGIRVENGRFVWPAERLETELEKAKAFIEELQTMNEREKLKALSEYREDFHKRMEGLDIGSKYRLCKDINFFVKELNL